jgi:hypothetical protein
VGTHHAMGIRLPVDATPSWGPPVRIYGDGKDTPLVARAMRVLPTLGVLATVTIVAALLMPLAAGTSVSSSGFGNGFNKPGDLLITDQFNNRVIEVNPLTKAIVWSFGSGNASLCNPGPGGVAGPNAAERLAGGLTLIAGTGVP